MSIRSQAQLEKLRAIGRIVRLALDQTAAAVRAGVTTAELDEIGARVLRFHVCSHTGPNVNFGLVFPAAHTSTGVLTLPGHPEIGASALRRNSTVGLSSNNEVPRLTVHLRIGLPERAVGRSEAA